jgi:hypothetical protein
MFAQDQARRAALEEGQLRWKCNHIIDRKKLKYCSQGLGAATAAASVVAAAAQHHTNSSSSSRSIIMNQQQQPLLLHFM